MFKLIGYSFAILVVTAIICQADDKKPEPKKEDKKDVKPAPGGSPPNYRDSAQVCDKAKAGDLEKVLKCVSDKKVLIVV